MSKLIIYKASAGSGKTHSLTEEYLKLAALYPENFKRILAVTFTNKAAEEMKQRILESLNNIINQGCKADFYNLFVTENSKNEEFTIIEKAKALRDSILHNYSFFSLSTIDSFVQKVIKSFTYEIGVESGYKIELDSEKVLTDLADLLYKQIDCDIDLRNYLIHFANFKMAEGKNWDFRSEINKLAREIFKEQFQTTDNQNENENDYNYILNYFNEVNEIKLNFEKNIREIGQIARKAFENQIFDSSIHGQNLKYLHTYLVNKIIEPVDQDSFVPNNTIVSMLDEVERWANKTAKSDVKAIVQELFYAINPLLNKALQLIQSDYKYYLSALNILSAFHAFGILRKLAALLPDYRNQNNILLISDTTRILKEIIAGNDAPFIYEKIGNRFRHVLIDEFQDTSGFQWDNFKPLIKNNLAEGQQNLIVGDIKQSIYRWRGGDWSLLLSKAEQDVGSEYVQHENLKVNWRSKKNIIDFNNSMFKSASEKLQQLFDNEYNEVIDKHEERIGLENYKNVITRAYADTFQELPNQSGKKGGRVKIKFFKLATGDTKKDWHDKVAVELPETIEQLLTQKNYLPGDLAILVRKNDEGKEVANLLLDYQEKRPNALKYQIISSDSLMLSNSPAIQILINAMYYIFDDNDKIHLHALIAVFISTFKTENDLSDIHFNTRSDNEVLDFLPRQFIGNLDIYRRTSIYEMTEQLCQVFSLNQIEGQNAYIQSFKDIIADFGQNEVTDLGAFLQWWNEKGKLNSVQLSDQQDAVKIFSIHKSKGLAFKVVIIPFCDWPLKPNPLMDTIIWTESDIPPFDQFKRFPVIFRKYLVNSIFYEEYYKELLYSMIDALNMLYVAFTRPREELIIMAPAKEKEEGKYSSVADLLYESVHSGNHENDVIDLKMHYHAETGIFELHQDYLDIDGDKFVKDLKEKPTFIMDDYPLGDWNQKINMVNHAEDFFMKSIEYIENKVNYGTLMHEIFSRIRDDKEIDYIIDEFYFSGKIGSDERKTLVSKVNEMINRPVVADWFSNTWKVKTEDAILDVSGKIRIPDRVLFKPDETVVIDFKFGEYQQESIEQVKEYMGLLKNMDYPNIKGFIYYAEKNRVDEVIIENEIRI